MKHVFYELTARVMKQNKTRTIVTVMGVVLSTAMLTAVFLFASSLQQYLIRETIRQEGKWHVNVSGLTRDQLEQLRQDDRVREIELESVLGYAKDEEQDGSYFAFVSREKKTWDTVPVELVKGRLPENETEILIPYEGVKIGGQELSVGDTVSVDLKRFCDEEGTLLRANEIGAILHEEDTEVSLSAAEEQTAVYKVTGVADALTVSREYMQIGSFVLVGPWSEGTEYCAYIEMKNPHQTDAFIADWLDSGKLERVAWSRHSSLLRWEGVFRSERYVQMIAGVLGLLILVIMAGSISLIYNSFSISVRERTSQMGLLSSVGATRKQLRSSVAFEAFAVSAAGIPLGLLAGIAGSGVTLYFIGGGLAAFIYGKDGSIPLYIYPPVLVFAGLLALVTVCLSVWIPSRRIRKISPIDAIRSARDIRVRPGEVKKGYLLGRIAGLPGMLASKNYGRDRRKYRSTVISLTISIVLLTTVSLFMMYAVSSGGVILQAPAYDIQYTVIPEGGENDEALIDGIQKVLKEDLKADQVWEMEQTGVVVPMEKEEAEAISDSRYYGETLTDGRVPFYCNIWALEDKDYEAFIEKQDLEMPVLEEGTIHAVYYDPAGANGKNGEREGGLPDYLKGVPLGAGTYGTEETEGDAQVLRFSKKMDLVFEEETAELPAPYDQDAYGSFVLVLSESQLHQCLELMMAEGGGTEEEASQWSCSAAFFIADEDYRSVLEGLEEVSENLPEENSSYVYSPAEAAALNRQSLAAIRVLCYGFIILISLIAVANVFNTISTNLMLRRREMSMLRSIGMTRKDFRRMLIYECLIYGIRSVAYGTFLSLLISFGFWRFMAWGGGAEGFLFPWTWLLAAVIGVFAIVLITMIYTMKKIRKLNIIEELRMM